MTPDAQRARPVFTRGDGTISRGDDRAYYPPQPFPQPQASPRSQPFPQAPPPPLSTESRAFPQSRPSSGSNSVARHGREDASIIGAIPFFAVLVVTIAGVYIAWRQGSAGGGAGGIVGGAALLLAATARLLLPARLVGLLATRKRANDVVTLAIFGVGLLVAGLVLPG